MLFLLEELLKEFSEKIMLLDEGFGWFIIFRVSISSLFTSNILSMVAWISCRCSPSSELLFACD